MDTAVHEVADDGTLVELHKASGGAWGGIMVDHEFYRLIEEMFGKEVVPEIKSKFLWDWMKMCKEFETRKRQVQLDADEERSLKLQIPPRFFINSQKNMDFLTSFDKLELKSSQFHKFFEPVVMKIVSHVRTVLQIVPEVRLILMVGGFSESKYVQSMMEKEFPQKRMIVPLQAGLAVLEGAVLFGFNPRSIAARICRQTYGVRALYPYKEGEHNPDFKCIVDGREMCENIFKILVREGERISLNTERCSELLSSHKEETRRNMELTVPVFASKMKDPKYTTDEGCVDLGVIRIQPPPSGWTVSEQFKVSVYFGRTEFKVTVYNKSTNKKHKATFDFLKDD